MKKKIIVLSILFVIIFAVVNAATNSTYDESKFAPSWGIEDKTVKMRADGKGEIMPPLVKDPEPYYKANKDITKEKLYDINIKIDKEKLQAESAEVKMVEVMTYGDYLNTVGSTDRLTSLALDRLVYVVKVYYPNGVKVDGAFLRRGMGNDFTIKNAMKTTLYDAETGEFLSENCTALSK